MSHPPGMWVRPWTADCIGWWTQPKPEEPLSWTQPYRQLTKSWAKQMVVLSHTYTHTNLGNTFQSQLHQIFPHPQPFFPHLARYNPFSIFSHEHLWKMNWGFPPTLMSKNLWGKSNHLKSYRTGPSTVFLLTYFPKPKYWAPNPTDHFYSKTGRMFHESKDLAVLLLVDI